MVKYMHELAFLKGGKCLSDEYINCKVHLKWECSEGHIWKSTLDNVKCGYWCKICGHKHAAETRRKNDKKYDFS